MASDPKIMSAQSSPLSVTLKALSAVKSVGKFVEEIDANVTKAQAVQAAMNASKLTFSSERSVIDVALRISRADLEIEAKLEADPEIRKYFDSNYARIEEAINRKREVAAPERNQEEAKLMITPITPPSAHVNPEINAAILAAHWHLMEQRALYFDRVRAEIRSNPRLAQKVRDRLHAMDQLSSWRNIENNKEL
ncbi:hypothetical protein [Rhizobium leguminosarum]|uniref:hypothetical protein n=1 Tax=Rhizobium leguminosarum TaxID=384 RepID=UPI001AE41471|nr:hypothetical protein [Rhizobium leguminosarum]MBP2442703.1 hypothetical protein [Rhizobium leguminosarum]